MIVDRIQLAIQTHLKIRQHSRVCNRKGANKRREVVVKGETKNSTWEVFLKKVA